MIVIACIVALMLICLAALVFGIYLLYKAVKYRLLNETEAVVTFSRYFGGLVFSIAGLVGFLSEFVFLLSFL